MQIVDPRPRTLDPTGWTLDPTPWTLDPTPWTLYPIIRIDILKRVPLNPNLLPLHPYPYTTKLKNPIPQNLNP
jgi:hypothetical protein